MTLSRDEALRLLSGADDGARGDLSAEARRRLFDGQIAYESAYGYAQRQCERDKKDDDARVQLRSQRDAARAEFGSPPHNDRVLTIVLVMPDGVSASDVRVARVEPNTPHAEEFWQDAGRAPKGHQGSAEVPVAPESVQPACPTGDRGDMHKWWPHGWPSEAQSKTNGCTCDWWGYGSIARFADDCPIRDAHKGAPKAKTVTTVSGGGAYMHDGYLYRWRCWADVLAIAKRCNDFWTAETHTREVGARRRAMARAGRALALRQDLIERIGPLSEPIPEGGTMKHDSPTFACRLTVEAESLAAPNRWSRFEHEKAEALATVDRAMNTWFQGLINAAPA